VATYELTAECVRNRAELTPAQRVRLRRAVERFVADLNAGQGFRPGLRVKRVVGMQGCWEMTWAPDGRAIFMYGGEVRPGEVHIVWLAVGTHDILP
jgi:hypothetical protein